MPYDSDLTLCMRVLPSVLLRGRFARCYANSRCYLPVAVACVETSFRVTLNAFGV
jgi:hypothetical protein